MSRGVLHHPLILSLTRTAALCGVEHKRPCHLTQSASASVCNSGRTLLRAVCVGVCAVGEGCPFVYARVGFGVCCVCCVVAVVGVVGGA